jgi:hypothetical protein
LTGEGAGEGEINDGIADRIEGRRKAYWRGSEEGGRKS